MSDWRAEMFLGGRVKIPPGMTSEEYAASMGKQYLSLPKGKPRDYYDEEGGGVSDAQYTFPSAITMNKSQLQSTSTLGNRPRGMYPHPNRAKIANIN